MSDSTKSKKLVFDTSGPFATLAGFLILPALGALLIFISSFIIVIFSEPANLDKLDLYTYYVSLFFIPYLLISSYFWIKRKRVLRILMVIFFAIQAFGSIYYMVQGLENEFINIFINVVWLFYFIVSRRAKQTFIR